MPAFNSLIVGPGAIGALTALEIEGLGDIWVYPHRGQLNLAQRLIIKNQSHGLTWRLLNNRDTKQTIDFIWVCCKANHVMQTLPALLEQYPKADAILLHNGMGPQQQLTARFGERIICGSTTSGALTTEPGVFSQTSFGKTELGLHPQLNKHLQLLNQIKQKPTQLRPLKIEHSPNIAKTLWRKLLINACINPITAALQIRNGQLPQSPHFIDVIKIIDEVNQIIVAEGLSPITDALSTVKQVCEFSANNFSSMAVDVQQQRRTEIDFINGFLIEQAQRFNLATPTLKKWYKRIAQLPEN